MHPLIEFNGSASAKHDYGLVQWCQPERKGGLYDYAKQQNESIGSLSVQANYVWVEMQSMTQLLNIVTTTGSVSKASDAFFLIYEWGSSYSETADPDGSKGARRGYAEKIYQNYIKQYYQYSQ